MTTTAANLTEGDVVRANWSTAGPWLSGDELIGGYRGDPVGMLFLRAAAQSQLAPLGALRSGWDSYAAPPIDPLVIDHAMQFLVYVGQEGLPEPFVVPTSRGGITFEWYRGERELTFKLDPDAAEPDVFLVDDGTGEEWQGPFSSTRREFLPTLLRMGR